MPTLTPKKREILAREQKILQIARPIIVRHGYHGLNMDRIAEKLQYSKGTIYNHFSCKEEIIIALAIQTVEKRVELFQQAAQFQARPRFRMIAISEAAEKFVRDYPDYFQFEQILSLDSVLEKTSEKRRAVIRGCEMQCMGMLAGIVRDGIAQQDLKLPAGMSAEEIVFALWALTNGGYGIMFQSESLDHLGLHTPFETVKRHQAAILDGYNWKPLFRNYDDDQLRNRIRREIFGVK